MDEIGLAGGVRLAEEFVAGEELLHLGQGLHPHPRPAHAVLAAPEVAADLGGRGLEQEAEGLPHSCPLGIYGGGTGVGRAAVDVLKPVLGQPGGYRGH